MASYSLRIKKSAQKEIRKLPSDYRSKVVQRIDALKHNPLPRSAEKIKGIDNVYRFRQGIYRIIYSIDNNQLIILVIKVSHRKDSYKHL